MLSDELLHLPAGIEKKTVKGKTVYSIEGGRLLICLEERVTAGALRGMMELRPQQIICLDNAFGGNDQLKTNTVLETTILSIASSLRSLR